MAHWERLDIYERDGFRCLYCDFDGSKFETSPFLTIDHINPHEPVMIRPTLQPAVIVAMIGRETHLAKISNKPRRSLLRSGNGILRSGRRTWSRVFTADLIRSPPARQCAVDHPMC